MNGSDTEKQIPGLDQKKKFKKWYTPLTRVTTLSRYLALVLFVALPFIGFWLGVEYSKNVWVQEKDQQPQQSGLSLKVLTPREDQNTTGKTISGAYVVNPGADNSSVHILFSDQTEFVAPEDKTIQEYFSGFVFAGTDDVRLEKNHPSVAWENNYLTGGQSYAIPLSLSIFLDGKVAHVIVPGQMIWYWSFMNNGTQIALVTGATHGADSGTYQLYDVSSGKMIDSTDGPLTKQSPNWATALDLVQNLEI